MPDDSMGPAEAEPRTEVDVLRNRIYQLENCGIVELAVINPNVMDYMRHWEGRVETTEAQFTKLWRELAASQAEVERLRAALKP